MRWRLKVALRSKFSPDGIDPDRILVVSPRAVRLYLGGKFGNRFYTRGKVRDGDWDQQAGPFEGWDVYKAIKHHFIKGIPWEETKYYQRGLTEIEAGKTIRGASSIEELRDHFSRVDKLFENIKNRGFLAQRELVNRKDQLTGWEPESSFSKFDEITLAINRKGQFMLQDGKHRLSIAKILDLTEVPVAVGLRHKKWEMFKSELLDYTADRHGTSYQPFTHPDLQDIPVQHNSARELMIKQHMPTDASSILDIGAYIGYFDLFFSALGYECTAIEHHPRHVYFMRKLMEAEGLQFRIIDSSFLEWKEQSQFDVVLALNIFHHFIQTKSLMVKMEERIKSIEIGCIFLETHRQEDEIMKGAYMNFAPMEFAQYVSSISDLPAIEEIGATSRGRRMFKISRER